MTDNSSLLDGLKSSAVAALSAQRDGEPGWQEQWADALEAASECLDAIADMTTADDPRLWPVSSLLEISAEWIRDEGRGAKAHFWQQTHHRPPASNVAREKVLLLAALVSGCAEKRKRNKLSETSYRLAQRALRKHHLDISLSQIRSAASNASRLPERERSMLARHRADIKVQEANPDHLIDYACEALCELRLGVRQ